MDSHYFAYCVSMIVKIMTELLNPKISSPKFQSQQNSDSYPLRRSCSWPAIVLNYMKSFNLIRNPGQGGIFKPHFID